MIWARDIITNFGQEKTVKLSYYKFVDQPDLTQNKNKNLEQYQYQPRK